MTFFLSFPRLYLIFEFSFSVLLFDPRPFFDCHPYCRTAFWDPKSKKNPEANFLKRNFLCLSSNVVINPEISSNGSNSFEVKKRKENPEIVLGALLFTFLFRTCHSNVWKKYQLTKDCSRGCMNPLHTNKGVLAKQNVNGNCSLFKIVYPMFEMIKTGIGFVRLIHTWHKSYSRRALAWLTHICDMAEQTCWFYGIQFTKRFIKFVVVEYDVVPACVWPGADTCVTWPIHVCDVMYMYGAPPTWVLHVSYTCVM